MSVLAQAQQLVSTGAIERLAGFAGELSGIWPEARHKVDAGQMIDDYAEALGTDPKTVRSDDEAAAMSAAEQQAAAAAAMTEQAGNVADAAKTASETDVTSENALTNMMRNAGLA